MKISSLSTLKASSFSALALAFASLGDAFLYPFLPTNFADVGVPVAWVGILLSINRFVRIVANTLIVQAFTTYGLRTMMIIAVIIAVLSTAGYGLATGVFGWLVFRIVWGLAFSAMRTGTLGYALQHQHKGFSLGVSRSLQESGPMLALFLSPILLSNYDAKIVFYFLAAFSLPALFFAYNLPRQGETVKVVASKTRFSLPTTVNLMTFISAFVIDGIIVIVLGVLFLRYSNEIDLVAAATLSAFYLGYRRICTMSISPAGGWVADKIGLNKIFNLSVIMVIVGLIVMIYGWIGTGAIIIFTFYSIKVALTPGAASANHAHPLAAVAQNATWRDIGAAFGALLGGFLITSPYLTQVLVIGTVAMAILLLIHAGTLQRSVKLFAYENNNCLP